MLIFSALSVGWKVKAPGPSLRLAQADEARGGSSHKFLA